MKFKNVDKRRLVIVVCAVIMMGLALSFLNRTNLGTDPCTMFNLGMSRLLGISLGTWQALFNLFLYSSLQEIRLGGERLQICFL